MGDAAEAAKEKARELGEDAKRSAKETAERSGERWSSMASDQILAVCSAMQAAAERLHDEDQPKIGKWVDDAASEIQRFAGYLDDEDPASMMHDVEDMARKNTGAFLGTAFAAGMAMGRFLRSSEPDGENGRGQDEGRESPDSTNESQGQADGPPEPSPESRHTTDSRDMPDSHGMPDSGGPSPDMPDSQTETWPPRTGHEEPVAPREIL